MAIVRERERDRERDREIDRQINRWTDRGSFKVERCWYT